MFWMRTYSQEDALCMCGLIRSRALLTLATILFAFPGQAAEFHITEASNGIAMTFDKRTKTKVVDPVLLTWLTEGSFEPDGERTIRCSATVFDGKTQEGFGKRRAGVKLTLAGEIHDGAGNTLEVLPTKKAKTDKNGQATVRFSIGDFDGFYATIGASFAKKKMTSFRLGCVAVAEAGDGSRPAQGFFAGPEPIETIQWAVATKRSDRRVKLKKWERLELDFDAKFTAGSIIDCLFRTSESGVVDRLAALRAEKPKVRGSWQVREARGGEIVAEGEYAAGAALAFVLQTADIIPNLPDSPEQELTLLLQAGLAGGGKTEGFSARCSVKPE